MARLLLELGCRGPQSQVTGHRSDLVERVNHDGRETAYRVAGSNGAGPTALYVHGSGANHRMWGHQFAPAGPTHPAVALDLSGHGDSGDIDTDAGPATLSAYAADTVAVARETDADLLVGHSMGGAVVFEVLLETEFEPSGVVFADTGAKLAVHESIRTLLRDDFEGLVDMLHGDSWLLHGDVDSEVSERSRDALLSAGQAVTRRDFRTCHTFDVRDRVGDIDVPALAVVGEYDSMTPPEYHEFLADRLPDCTLATIADAGHMSMLEQPQAFTAAVASFCERIK